MDRTRRFAVTMLGAITLSSVLGAPRRPIATAPMRLQGQTASAVTWQFDSLPAGQPPAGFSLDRKSTRLNSSHLVISYAVFCLKKKKQHKNQHHSRPSFT